MKRTKLLLLNLVMFIPMMVNADPVGIDGIFYNLVSKAKVAVVTRNPNKYSGEVIIPQTVTYDGEKYIVNSIDLQAFEYCNDLISVTIPNSITSIANKVFNGCTGLTTVVIPSSVISIDYSAFGFCSGLISVTIPNSVTSIGDFAFSDSGLTSVTIPNSITSISAGTFYNCTVLPSVTIPNSVTSIDRSAFSNCDRLPSVSLPNSVTSIGNEIFSSCDDLSSITIGSAVTPYEGSYIEYATLHVPNGSVDAYKAAEPWRNFKNIVGDGGTGIDMIKVNVVSEPFDVYDMSGRRVLNSVSSLNGLPQGIYIVNGKKILKK